MTSTGGSGIQGKNINKCADVVSERNRGKPGASFSIVPGVPMQIGYVGTKGGAVPPLQS